MCLGIPMKVTELIPPHKARVETGQISLEISTQVIEKVEVGQYVLVHAGFALEVLDDKAAEETLALLREMAQAEEDAKNESNR